MINLQFLVIFLCKCGTSQQALLDLFEVVLAID